MNFTLLILGILLIFVLYLLYRYLYAKPSDIVGSKIYLKDSPSSQILPKPTATRYSYSLWIYPVSLQAPKDTIFAISPNFSLEITNSGALQYTIKIGANDKTNVITPNFPLQKWNYVIVSVDNTVVDTYLDGKLVQSSQLTANPTVSSNSKTITFGNGDIYLSKFQVLPNPMDPQTAWSTYIAGNGTNSLTTYGAYVELTKDSVDMQKYTLF